MSKELGFSWMTIRSDKTVVVIAFALMLATSALITTIQVSSAQTYTKSFKTYAYLHVSPNPVGVNQPVNVVFWLDSSPPQRSGEPYYGWQITVEITRPDGEKEIRGPIETDSVGGRYIIYTPNQIGTYKFKAKFPGQEVNLPKGALSFTPGIYYFEPSESRVVELTVQQEQVQAWPETPLPTGYWSRPISAEHRDWSQIAGNWLEAMGLSATGYNAYTKGPESAHIVWTKPVTFGGIAGGELGWGKAYYNGIVYEKLFNPPVIISGRLYYNMYTSGFGAAALPGVVCVDLRSGEEIWRKEDMPQINRGQVLNFEGENQYGAIAYLWSTSGTTWKMYNAFTGVLVSTFENAASGTFAYGPKGELLVYILNGQKNWLTLWNSTRTFVVGLTGWSAGAWRPSTTVDWRKGIQWNVSLPDVPGVQQLRVIDIKSGVLVAEATDYAPTFVHVGYDAATGAQLWVKNRTGYGYGFSGPGMAGLLSPMSKTINEGVYVFYEKETLKWHAFDAKSGNYMWSTVPLNTLTGTDYSMYDWAPKIAYGKLYVTGYSGCVIAFDLKTGKHLWTYSQGSSGLQTPYGSWPVLDGLTCADGKLYVPCVEHTPYTPMMLGYTLFCIDAETGEFLWKIPGFPTNLAIADGYLVALNGYDMQIYCFGKGPTKTTVTIQKDVISLGESVLITGKVTDISSGVYKDDVVANRFPNGLPAASDSDMTEWMKYVYMQYPAPGSVGGVTVELYAISETGATEHIGTTTTDPLNNGIFKVLWTPHEKGTYTITAVFGGSKSYWDSYASTALGVTEAAPQPVTPATPEQVETATTQATQSAVQTAIDTLQPMITALIVIVVVCVCLVSYDIYINRKMLRHTTK